MVTSVVTNVYECYKARVQTLAVPPKFITDIVQGIFAKIGPDLELRWGDLISSPVDSKVSLVSPKKSYGPNSVGKNYFSATPFSLLAKNATGGHNA